MIHRVVLHLRIAQTRTRAHARLASDQSVTRRALNAYGRLLLSACGIIQTLSNLHFNQFSYLVYDTMDTPAVQ